MVERVRVLTSDVWTRPRHSAENRRRETESTAGSRFMEEGSALLSVMMFCVRNGVFNRAAAFLGVNFLDDFLILW